MKFTQKNNSIIHEITSKGNSFKEHLNYDNDEFISSDIFNSGFHASLPIEENNTLASNYTKSQTIASNTSYNLTNKTNLITQNDVFSSSESIPITIELKYKNSSHFVAKTIDYHLSNKNQTVSNHNRYWSYNSPSSIVTRSYTSQSTIKIENSSLLRNSDVLSQVESNLSVTQNNESNNLVTTASITTPSLPDLVIQNAEAPTVTDIGGTIQLKYQVKNQGSGDAFYSYTIFYLSKDQNVSDDDFYLGANYVDSIAAGSYSSELATLTIDNGIAPGSYYLLCQADGNGESFESNETNNILAKAININLVNTDLIVQNAVAPSSISVGYSFNVSYQIKNQGLGNAFPSSTIFYLSKDKAVSSDDLYLGSKDVDSIKAGAYSSQTTSLSIVNNITAGNYYLLYKADGYNNVIETNEINNIVAKAINVKNSFSSTNGYGLINAAAAVAKVLGQTTFGDVANLGGNNWGADLIKAPEVWAKGYTGQGITVAVVDSGVDRNHADLSSNIWKNLKEIAGNGKDDDGNGYVDDVYGWNFVDNNNNTLDKNGHGTHVAGTIAGVRNGFGVTGIAYNAKIMPVKVLADNGSGSDDAIAQGIRYAADNGANVINLSLGKEQSSIAIQSAIQYASSKGAITVMAAGNGSLPTPYYPASYAKDWGLAVGAVDKYGNMANFSNRAGNNLLSYVTAPGVGIYSTLPGNKYGSLNGTSMATPHIAGVVALMLSANKGLTDSQVRQIVTATAANSFIG